MAAPTERKQRGVVTRKDGRRLKRICIYVPAELAREVAVYAAEVDRDVSDIASEAIAKLLREVKK